MVTPLDFKRGATFSFGGLVPLPAGTWTATAQLRDFGAVKIVDLAVTLTPPVAPDTQYSLLLECPASATASWPKGVLLGDIKFADASVPPLIITTSTFGVNVIEAETL